jgi:hypothetical protein
LPGSIRQLALCQFVRLRHRHRRRDLAHIVDSVMRLIEYQGNPRRGSLRMDKKGSIE